MTTLGVIDGGRRETRTEAIARRLRGKMGEARISGVALGRAIKMNNASLSRRLNGKFPFTVDELDLICDVLGCDADEVFSGIKNPRQDGPDGGGSAPSRTRTYDLRIKSP